jgi:hypothetical protein
VLTGWRKALVDMAEAYKDNGVLLEEATKRTFNVITDSFAGLFSDVLRGEFESFGDFFEDFANRLLDIWIDMIAQMAARSVMGELADLVLGQFGLSSPATGGSDIGTSIVGSMW